jgi:hypothetical protein
VTPIVWALAPHSDSNALLFEAARIASGLSAPDPRTDLTSPGSTDGSRALSSSPARGARSSQPSPAGSFVLSVDGRWGGRPQRHQPARIDD